jgi:voltage-gated sodium channel
MGTPSHEAAPRHGPTRPTLDAGVRAEIERHFTKEGITPGKSKTEVMVTTEAFTKPGRGKTAVLDQAEAIERMSNKGDHTPGRNTVTASTEELIHNVLTKIEDPADKLESSIRKWAHRLYHSDHFTTAVSLVILINAIYIGFETENPNWSQTVDGQPPTHEWETLLVEVFFQSFFIFELSIKFLGHGMEAFHDSLTLFDIILVMIGFVDIGATVLFTYTDGFGGRVDERQSAGVSASLLSLRVLRIVRISRVLRLLRLLRAFKELWLMVSGIMSSVRTILWAWTLIVLIIYVFAIIAVRVLGRGEDQLNPWVHEYFGGVRRSMFTYFQIMTLEGWAEIARPLIGLDAEFRHFFYPAMVGSILLFMSITSFAIMNVVVAVIVENTLDQAVLKRDNAMQKIRREQKEAVSKAYEIFAACDIDGDGSLEKEEFMQALKDKHVQLYLHEVGIDVADAEGLFDILDHDMSGVLSVSEFVDGCIRARGGARAKEMMMLHCDIFKLFKKVRMDILALTEQTPTRVQHPWGKESADVEPNGERSAPEGQLSPASTSVPDTQVYQPSQTELRARVEDSLHKAESTLAEVKRRVSKELDVLEDQIGSRVPAARRSKDAPSRAPFSRDPTSTTAGNRAPLDDDEPERLEVEDLIRGSKTLEDLLRDVETDLTNSGQSPAI